MKRSKPHRSTNPKNQSKSILKGVLKSKNIKSIKTPEKSTSEPAKKLKKLHADPHIENIRRAYLRFYHSVDNSPTWKPDNPEVDQSSVFTSTLVHNMRSLYAAMSEQEFYADITKLANCKIESAGKLKGVLRIYEVIVQVNKEVVHIVESVKSDSGLNFTSAIEECIKSTINFTTNFINTHNFIHQLKSNSNNLFTSDKHYLKEILSHQSRHGAKIEYIKQTELTTRIVVHLLRSIGFMMSEIGEKCAIDWLKAALSMDTKAVCNYTALANFYKKQLEDYRLIQSDVSKILPDFDAEIALNYCYYISLASFLEEKPYKLEKGIRPLRKLLKPLVFETGNPRLYELRDKIQKFKPVKICDEHDENGKLIYLNNKRFHPDNLRHKNAKTLAALWLIRCTFFNHVKDGSDETPNIAYFTQAIWKFEEPEPEFLIKLFIVAWLGIEKLEVKLEHAVMVIIDAANAMGRMTPGCNISFYLLNLFALKQINSDPDNLKARLQFEIGDQWIPPNLKSLQNSDAIFDDDFLKKYELTAFEPFRRLENVGSFGKISKQFKEIPFPNIHCKLFETVPEIVVVKKEDFDETGLKQVLEKLGEILPGKKLYLALLKEDSTKEPWCKVDKKYTIPCRTETLYEDLCKKFERKLNISAIEIKLENVVWLTRSSNLEKCCLSIEDLAKVLENY